MSLRSAYSRVLWINRGSPAPRPPRKKVSSRRKLTRRRSFFFFFTLVTGPRRSLSFKLSETSVCDPQMRARLGTTARRICHTSQYFATFALDNFRSIETPKKTKHAQGGDTRVVSLSLTTPSPFSVASQLSPRILLSKRGDLHVFLGHRQNQVLAQ